ncbi:hypothetical protein [Streptococcus oralis]|uniref:hypothetical protein n=1 Tax=Streptococcus oralis TaxID=1303 RepID=UPI001CBBA997|nr:hypothetical protein [Streptococcus oralis]MBZ2095723.1 hypothetical protein [Streptococcus oralis]MBZ2100927.1 hypothetical protein [Streptococcus oralis]
MVNVYFYRSVQDYHNNVKSHNTINYSKKDFIRYLINAGRFRKQRISFNGIRFYLNLVRMALAENNGKFYITSDFSNSESSIKTAISYFIGILSAYAIADKHYNIPYLFHLKDPIITNITRYKGYNNIPDFFGFKNGSNNSPVLLEAKGTVKSKLGKDVISNAKKQLNAINSINFITSNASHTISTFERHITGSYFKKGELHFCDIDPKYTGDLVYNFDANLAIQAYYQNIMLLLQSGESHVRVVNGIKYHLVDFEGYTVGLNEFVFNKLQNRSEITGLYDSIYRRVVETYDSNIEFLKEESISLGRDGIIVL